MRELPIIDDKRLLGALDYIDERFIAEVTEEYEIFDTAPGAKLPPRARMYRFRQFAALAACLLLLSFASLGVNYVANAVISFAASAGGSNTKTSCDEQESDNIDSPYERAIDAYPEDMPIDEIYADVLKGGWVVSSFLYQSDFIEGKKLWDEFLDNVNNGIPDSVLLADYINYYADFSDSGLRINERKKTIYLMEIVYDGETFHYKRLDARLDKITDTGEYNYLITDINYYDGNNDNVVKSGRMESYCLTNDSDWTYQIFMNYICGKDIPSEDFYNNSCQVIATFITVNEWQTGKEGTLSLIGSLGFSEIITDEIE